MLSPNTSKVTIGLTSLVCALAGVVLYDQFSDDGPRTYQISPRSSAVPESTDPYEGFPQEQARLIKAMENARDDLQEEVRNREKNYQTLLTKNNVLNRELTLEKAARKKASQRIARERDAALREQRRSLDKAIKNATRELLQQQEKLKAQLKTNEKNYQRDRQVRLAEVATLKITPPANEPGVSEMSVLPPAVPPPEYLMRPNPAPSESSPAAEAAVAPAAISTTLPAEVSTALANQMRAVVKGRPVSYSPAAELNGAAPAMVSLEPKGVKTGVNVRDYLSLPYGVGPRTASTPRRKNRSSRHRSASAPAARVANNPSTRPRFTINSGAMIDVILQLDLNAYIPLNGSVTPYFALALVANSETNPATSGFYLPPEINEMKIMGPVIGDPIFQCAQVKITKISIAFADGTLAEPEASSSEPFGFLSAVQGMPCLAGTMKDNVDGYASKHAVFTILGQTTQTLAQSFTMGQIPDALTGGIAQGVTDWSKLLKDLNKDTLYAAVQVPSSVRIEGKINPISGTEYWPVKATWVVQNQVRIDYETDGRRLIHANQNTPHFQRARLD